MNCRALALLSALVALSSCLDFQGEVDRLCDAGAWEECRLGVDASTDAGPSDAGATDAGSLDSGANDAGATDGGESDAGSPCFGGVRGAWCWEHPLNTSNEVGAIWGSDAQLMVATSGGMLLELNQAGWTDRSAWLPPSTADVRSVPGVVTGHGGALYLFGEGMPVQEWNGSRFVVTGLTGDYVAASASSTRTLFLSPPSRSTILEVRDAGTTTFTFDALSGEARADLYVDDSRCFVSLGRGAVLDCLDGGTTAVRYADGGVPLLFRFFRQADGGLALGGSAGHLFEYTAGGWAPRQFRSATWSSDLVTGSPFLGETRVVGPESFVGDFESGERLFHDYGSRLKRTLVTDAGTFWAAGVAGSLISSVSAGPGGTRHDGAATHVSALATVRGLFVSRVETLAVTYSGAVLTRTGERQWLTTPPDSESWVSIWSDGQQRYLLGSHGALYLKGDSMPVMNLVSGSAIGQNSALKVAQLCERDGILWGASNAIVFALPLDGGTHQSVTLDGGDYVADLELVDGGVVVALNRLAGQSPSDGRVLFVSDVLTAQQVWAPTSSAPIVDLAVEASGAIWIAGDGLLGRITLDGGYQNLGPPNVASRTWLSVWLAPDGTAWALVDDGVVAVRRDGGWVDEIPPWGGGENFRPVALMGSDDAVWLFGSHGAVLRRPLP
ncbi:MAG: hypothetical protein AB1938_27800 [Myxococcota bacterium]